MGVGEREVEGEGGGKRREIKDEGEREGREGRKGGREGGKGGRRKAIKYST